MSGECAGMLGTRTHVNGTKGYYLNTSVVETQSTERYICMLVEMWKLTIVTKPDTATHYTLC